MRVLCLTPGRESERLGGEAKRQKHFDSGEGLEGGIEEEREVRLCLIPLHHGLELGTHGLTQTNYAL